MNKQSNIKIMIRMMRLVKPLTLQMIGAITLGVLGFLCAIGIPVLSTMLLLSGVGMVEHLPVENMFMLLIGLAVFRGIFHYFEQQLNHFIAFKLLAIIRDHVYTALRRLAPAKLDGKDKGNLISLITNDIELLEVFYAHTISPIFIAIFTTLIVLIVFLHIHPISMIIAFVAYIFVSIVIPYYVDKLGRHIGKNYRGDVGNLSSFVLESLRGVTTLGQYHMYDLRLKQMISHNTLIEHSEKKMKDIESMQIVLSQLIISFSSIVMFIVMFILNQNEMTSLFSVIIASVLMLSSFGPVLAVSAVSNNLLSTLNSGRRVLELLDEEELVKDVIDGESIEFSTIEVKDISFKYDDEDILSDFSMTLKEGEITGIVGKSGSGKSTLLKLIMRFYDVDKGSITINNKSVKNINTRSLRNMFAYVTQDTVLFGDSIKNNIKVAKLNASDEEIIQACKDASIHEFIMSLPQGYDTPVGELGNTLSAGEKQRISIARAFLSDAKCILLDEPTSNLDVLNEAMILKSLKASDKTIVLVSHRESTMKIADKVYRIEQGRLS